MPKPVGTGARLIQRSDAGGARGASGGGSLPPGVALLTNKQRPNPGMDATPDGFDRKG